MTPEQIQALQERVEALERAESERDAALESLAASEKRYRKLVENAPLCIHIIDLKGRLQAMNPSGLRMMGIQGERDVQGLVYLNAVCDEDRPRVAALMDRAFAGEASEFEFRANTPALDSTYASNFVPIFDENGLVEQLMGCTRDISKMRRAEQAQRALELQLLEAKKLEGLGLLAGGVAHDFNTCSPESWQTPRWW
jgi:PAS domain S-box-containing protein